MQQQDIEFFNNLIKGYFGKCDAQIQVFGDKDGYYPNNVKFHTQDKKWLRGYVFNRVYKDFNPQNQVVFDIHHYVTTQYFDNQIKEYTDHVIDAYTKKILKGLKKDTLKNIEPKRRAGVVCELIISYLQKNLDIPRDVTMPRILKRQNEFIPIIDKIMKNENAAQSMIEKY